MATTSAFGPYDKYSGEDKDLGPILWAEALGEGNTILTSTWTCSPGITITGDNKTDTDTVVRVSGGSPGSTYYLKNIVTTSDGQTLEAEQFLKIKVDNVP